jgi:D-ribulokinase
MSDVALGIDIGTSGVRMAAVTRALAVVAFAEAKLPAPNQNGSRLTQDAGLWWSAVAACLESLDLKGHDLRAIAIDGTSGTIVAIDEAGRPLAPASMYNDGAEVEHVKAVADVASPETAALGATSPLARAMRFSVGRIVHQADWIAGKLG